MKDLAGTATTAVSAPVERCLALFADIDRYKDWYPEVVRDSAVLERGADGNPSKARAVLHVAVGPLVRDFNLLLTVRVDPPARVRLARIPHDPSDKEEFAVTWGAEPGRIRVALAANLSVPRFLPLGPIGDTMAQGFVSAAARALADG